jgi:hypothetical protein
MIASPAVRFYTKRLLVIGGAAGLVLTAVLLIYWDRSSHQPLSRFAPDGVPVFIEIKDPLNLLERLSSTQAWKSLASELDLPDTLNGLNLLTEALRFSGGDAGSLRSVWRSQLGLIVSGFEMSDGRITPYVTLIIDSQESGDDLIHLASRQIPMLLRRAYGDVATESYEHGRSKVMRYKSPDKLHQLLWTVVNRSLLIANREEAIQLTIDTAAGRRPSLKDNPHFQAIQATPTRPLSGYFSTKGITQALRAAQKGDTRHHRMLTGLLEILVGSFDSSVMYEMDVEQGAVVERYYLSGNPERDFDMTRLVKIPEGIPEIVKVIPQMTKGFTILRCAKLGETIDSLSAMFLQRLPVLSRAMIQEAAGEMKRSLGLASEETILDALGDEAAIVESDDPNLLFIIATKNRAKLAALVGRYLQRDGAKVIQTQHRGFEIYSSSDQHRQSFCFQTQHLFAGPSSLIKQAIDAQAAGATLAQNPDLLSRIREASPGAFEISVRFEVEDNIQLIGELLARLARDGYTKRGVEPTRLRTLVHSWPPTVRVSRPLPGGIQTETRSPLGMGMLMIRWL